MSLHADVTVPARDRRRLERLCRYVARPPLANERLGQCPDGRLALRLKTRWRDGSTHILMERSELIDRLVPLIPPPRAHQVRYHGILAPGASQRDWIVPAAETGARATDDPARDPTAAARASSEPGGPMEPTAGGPDRLPASAASSDSEAGAGPSIRKGPGVPDGEPARDATAQGTSRRSRWAWLLQRVFEIDALRCPRCGSALRLVAAIEGPAVARKILECLELPARAPPLEPAVAGEPDPPDEEASWLFDQTLPYDEP